MLPTIVEILGTFVLPNNCERIQKGKLSYLGIKNKH